MIATNASQSEPTKIVYPRETSKSTRVSVCPATVVFSISGRISLALWRQAPSVRSFREMANLWYDYTHRTMTMCTGTEHDIGTIRMSRTQGSKDWAERGCQGHDADLLIDKRLGRYACRIAVGEPHMRAVGLGNRSIYRQLEKRRTCGTLGLFANFERASIFTNLHTISHFDLSTHVSIDAFSRVFVTLTELL